MSACLISTIRRTRHMRQYQTQTPFAHLCHRHRLLPGCFRVLLSYRRRLWVAARTSTLPTRNPLTIYPLPRPVLGQLIRLLVGARAFRTMMTIRTSLDRPARLLAVARARHTNTRICADPRLPAVTDTALTTMTRISSLPHPHHPPSPLPQNKLPTPNSPP